MTTAGAASMLSREKSDVVPAENADCYSLSLPFSLRSAVCCCVCVCVGGFSQKHNCWM